jgi:cytochrome c biogenesis protein CcmG, thiol:disulfide interchange protein DsbE
MNRRRTTLLAGLAMAAVFVIALVIRIMPEIRLVGIGSAAPDFHAVDLQSGHPVSLDDYRGKVLLLNVWATWCQPCRIEMPAIERLSRRLRADTGFLVLAVSVDQADSSAVTAFARSMGITFDILHDQTGRIQQQYQTTGVPESFVINRQGVIVKKVIGASQWDSPVNALLIQRLLDEH